MREEGMRWLLGIQRDDGGWGGGAGCPASIEETALAIAALAANGSRNPAGINWLLEATDQGDSFPASPIGFYFAKLWYFERIYPQVWAVEALGRAIEE